MRSPAVARLACSMACAWVCACSAAPAAPPVVPPPEPFFLVTRLSRPPPPSPPRAPEPEAEPPSGTLNTPTLPPEKEPATARAATPEDPTVAMIQRTVRAGFAGFRRCYEDNLRNSPNLQARVSVRFVIGLRGEVVEARDAGSDIPDAATIRCVLEKVRELSFSPVGKRLTITYPIMFTPGS